MKKQWKILEPDEKSVNSVMKSLGCHPITARILVNRNISSTHDAGRFLNPSLNHLRSPFSVKDMDAAVNRLAKAIVNREKIMIFGDYDVDGITATTILLEFIRQTGIDALYYIPHRLKEGYSIQENHVREIAIPGGIDLIITVDCGTSSHEAVQAANLAGIDMIITDHHTISPPFPEALAVVNPKRPDCEAGFEHLAGVGVIFILLICLRKHLRDIDFWKSAGPQEPNLKIFCDLVALGTIADSVPLIDENRILTHTGIELIRTGHKRPGIQELLNVCKINPDTVTSGDIGFRLVPRLNAGGRMGHAGPAVDILKTRNKAKAAEIAQSLEKSNNERKMIEKEILDQIHDDLKSNPTRKNKNSIVLAREGWHEGVLGIAASRLVEQYYKPVVLISIRNNMGKGSARSLPGFDLYHGLSECDDSLEGYGGHAMAAGLRINPEKMKIFERKFEATVARNMKQKNANPMGLIDSILDLNMASNKLIDEIENLGPYGEGNPEPLFMARHVKVKSSQIVGDFHRRMILYQPSSGHEKLFQAIQFNIEDVQNPPDDFEQMAFKLQWNRWNGQKKPQIIVQGT